MWLVQRCQGNQLFKLKQSLGINQHRRSELYSSVYHPVPGGNDSMFTNRTGPAPFEEKFDCLLVSEFRARFPITLSNHMTVAITGGEVWLCEEFFELSAKKQLRFIPF
jgi:hypothetical protein